MMVIFWAIIIIGAYYIIKNLGGNNQNQKNNLAEDNSLKEAEQIAAQRYANGEITKKEYEEIKRTLH